MKGFIFGLVISQFIYMIFYPDQDYKLTVQLYGWLLLYYATRRHEGSPGVGTKHE